MKISVILFLLILCVAACGCVVPTPAAIPPAVSPTVTPSTGTSNVSIPDITGRWSGQTIGHVQGSGFFSHDAGIYTITGQQGYAFAGYKEYLKPDGNTYYENFSGAMTPDGDLIFADSVIGYSLGRLTGPDSMELLYGEDGPGARAFIQFFTRETQQQKREE